MSTIRVVNIQHSDATEPNIVLEADGTATFVSGITISGGTNLTVSGTAEFASGTVSAPGITFIDDNNTGIYEPAADTVAITTAATERLRVDNSGNVAIGGTTITDSNLLNIQGSGATKNIGIVLNDTNTSKIFGIQKLVVVRLSFLIIQQVLSGCVSTALETSALATHRPVQNYKLRAPLISLSSLIPASLRTFTKCIAMAIIRLQRIVMSACVSTARAT